MVNTGYNRYKTATSIGRELRYIECENPENATDDAFLGMIGNWDIFDDED